MMKKNLIFISIVFLFVLSSCSNAEKQDLDKVKVEVKFIDFHLETTKLDTQNLIPSILELNKKYKDFAPFFWSEIAALDTNRNYSDSMVRLFFTHKDLKALHDTVATVFANTQKQQKELTELLKFIKITDSSIQLPKEVYFYSSGLHHVAFTLQDTILGIGLDRFFGENYWPYQAMGHPAYLTKDFTIPNIPIEAAKAIYHNKYGVDYENKNFLELMIQEGELLYFLHQVLPDISDDRLMGYTIEQLRWCEENEVYIYKFFADQNLFYEKSPIKIMRYIAPNPTSMGMPAESPGRTGAYIGYQIIKNYADKTGRSAFEILHSNLDAQTILNQAKYKPKR